MPALGSAGLLILIFPRFDLGFLAWVALVPLLLAIEGQPPRGAFGLAFLTGLLGSMGVFSWILTIAGFRWGEFVLSGLYVGTYFGLFGAGVALLSRRTHWPLILTAPVLWVSLEYVRAHFFFLALPWGLLGHSQYLYLPVIQIASLTGVYGISFLIVMANAAMSELIRARAAAVRPVLVAASLVALLCTYGWIELTATDAPPTLGVTVIQPNIPQETKWVPAFRAQHLAKHVDLTRLAAHTDRSSLIIWPEASLPDDLHTNSALENLVTGLARETGRFLVVGSASRPKFGPRELRGTHWVNSAFVVSPRGYLEGPYNKIRLVPFAEFLPYRDSLPWPLRFTTQAGHFLPGQEHTLFTLEGTRFAVLICWENIFPDLVREFVKAGASFLVNITNEAWFGESAAPYQLLVLSVFRAVENHRAILRSANTGISAFIDPYGRIIGRVQDQGKDTFVEGYLTLDVPLAEGRTVYTQYGDVFAWLAILIAFLLLSQALLLATWARFGVHPLPGRPALCRKVDHETT